MTDSFIIETAGLRKRFESHEALCGLDLHVPAGSICGFLGRNGAGKTTTIKILLGMARASAGTARVFGLNAGNAAAGVAIRSRCAFVSEEKDLFDSMTVTESIRFTASFYPRWRQDLETRYLRRFDLRAESQVKTLSGGMRTKLALLLALSRGAELLILDEPTSALDPAATEEVLQALVAHVANEEMTVFFSSHQIAEVEQIADRVSIIHRGRMVLESGLDDLRENFRRIDAVFEGPAPNPLLRTRGVEGIRRDGRALSVMVSAGEGAITEEIHLLNPVSLSVFPVTLKDIFLEVTGRDE